ncbi:DUF2357 domain-containing protein [Desulfosporosinus youngiae]|uniref:DUF2357 domain-containing protein n=1 Tax=Desulfosporosinus youngiae DSM 17734 TaxID=768710 RepID=H5Y2X7_9FIRM|nr:DUF2357 domain-containing protein [Desulfosporosinus youngiae]EHQ88534.1 hypothetical protein DesyoDRAFT_1376 [Desulfosporosinus youngiae DSM 17734]
MAMHLEDKGISIVFYLGRQDSPCLVSQHSVIEVFERENLYVSYSSDEKDAYLYIDGLDGYDSSLLHLDEEGIPCLRSGTYHFPLYCDANEDYPLIPGDYMVFVKRKGEVSDLIEATLRVRPNNITEDQLDVMRNELNDMVQGLAYDQMRTSHGIKLWGENGLLPTVVLAEYVLLKYMVKELGLPLQDLARHPEPLLERQYREVKSNVNCKQDGKSYRWLLSLQGQRANAAAKSMAQPEVILGVIEHLTYDTPENRMVLGFLQCVSSQMEFVLRSIRKTIAEEQRAIYSRAPYADLQKSTSHEVRASQVKIERLESMEREMKKGIFDVQTFMDHPVFRGLKPLKTFSHFSLKMQRDWRYKKVASWWKQLRDQGFEIPQCHDFKVQWKRTDVLYEYWCYIKTIIALEQVGFAPVAGWIYDASYRTNQEIMFPVLQEDTIVEMVKGLIRLAVSFNEKMPRAKRSAIRNSRILYMEGTNYKPDIRIDIFIRDVYKGSIVVDAKYRKRLNIWNNDRVEDDNRPKNMNTLQNYSNSLKYVGDPAGVSKAIKVIALHPSYGSEIEEIEDTNVSIIQLRPKERLTHYSGYLQGLIQG